MQGLQFAKAMARFVSCLILPAALILVAILFCTVRAETITIDRILSICNQNNYQNCKLVKAIAWVETNNKPAKFNPEKSGSYGLMQIQCSTARMLNYTKDCKGLYKAQTNIAIGVKYLKWLTKIHDLSDIKSLIAAWNSGTPIVCKKWNPGKCYPGQFINEDYVRDVYDHYVYLGGDPEWKPQQKHLLSQLKVTQKKEITSIIWQNESQVFHKTMMNMKWLSPMKSSDMSMVRSYPFIIDF